MNNNKKFTSVIVEGLIAHSDGSMILAMCRGLRAVHSDAGNNEPLTFTGEDARALVDAALAKYVETGRCRIANIPADYSDYDTSDKGLYKAFHGQRKKLQDAVTNIGFYDVAMARCEDMRAEVKLADPKSTDWDVSKSLPAAMKAFAGGDEAVKKWNDSKRKALAKRQKTADAAGTADGACAKLATTLKAIDGEGITYGKAELRAFLATMTDAPASVGDAGDDNAGDDDNAGEDDAGKSMTEKMPAGLPAGLEAVLKVAAKETHATLIAAWIK